MDKFTKLHDLTQEQIDEVSEALWDALSYIEDEDEQLDAHFKGMTSNSLCDLEDTINIYNLSFMKEDTTPIIPPFAAIALICCSVKFLP